MIFFIFVLFSAFFLLYFVLLQFLSPGTFFGTVFGFSMVWLFAAVFFGVLAFFQKKNLLRPFFKRLRGRIKVLLGIFAGLFLLICGINIFFICRPALSDGTERVKYVIVLGGGITKDAQLTDSVQNRLKTASEYLKTQPEALAVVTGGKGPFSPCPESDVLKPALENLGIGEERILAENKAKDTIQNFLYSLQLLSQRENKTLQEILTSPVAVVTSDFHLARAERLARRMGFTEIYGVAAPTPPLFVLNSYGREICSYIKLNLRIFLTGKPSSLTVSSLTAASPASPQK